MQSTPSSFSVKELSALYKYIGVYSPWSSF